jgi:hypothetical protein
VQGRAAAAGAALHGAPPERFRAREQARAFFWGGLLPALIVAAAFATAIASGSFGASALVGVAAIFVFALTVYGLKIILTAMSQEAPAGAGLAYGLFSTLGHFPEFAGVLRYWFGGKASPDKKDPAAR